MSMSHTEALALISQTHAPATALIALLGQAHVAGYHAAHTAATTGEYSTESFTTLVTTLTDALTTADPGFLPRTHTTRQQLERALAGLLIEGLTTGLQQTHSDE